MDFVIFRTSKDDIVTVKSFSTLEEVLHFMKEQKNPIIISNNFYKNIPIHSIMDYTDINEDTAKRISKCEYDIEIYDDYRE